MLYDDDTGDLFRPKAARRAAGLRVLEQEFGINLPQQFVRPAYKWVNSPMFPPGQKWYAQTVFDYCGETKKYHANSTFPIISSRWTWCLGHDNEGKQRRWHVTKKKCWWVGGSKSTNEKRGCRKLLCSSCYNYLRPLHSKERQMRAGYLTKRRTYSRHVSQNPTREKIIGKIQVSAPTWPCWFAHSISASPLSLAAPTPWDAWNTASLGSVDVLPRKATSA